MKDMIREMSRGGFRELNSLNLKIILSMIINVLEKPDGLVWRRHQKTPIWKLKWKKFSLCMELFRNLDFYIDAVHSPILYFCSNNFILIQNENCWVWSPWWPKGCCLLPDGHYGDVFVARVAMAVSCCDGFTHEPSLLGALRRIPQGGQSSACSTGAGRERGIAAGICVDSLWDVFLQLHSASNSSGTSFSQCQWMCFLFCPMTFNVSLNLLL